MFTVALIGADGAGKTTIGRQLANALPWPVKYVYMGINLECSNIMLPTTRLMVELKRLLGHRPVVTGPPDPTREQHVSRGWFKSILRRTKSNFRLLNLMAEEWFRQCLVWLHQSRGRMVLFDRHFYLDYYAHDVIPTGRKRPLMNRVHGWMLGRFYPKPDLVLFLDAAPEVLFARKGEGTRQLLESRRQEYLRLRDAVPNFVSIDAARPTAEVLADVVDCIRQFGTARGVVPIAADQPRSLDVRDASPQADPCPVFHLSPPAAAAHSGLSEPLH